MLLLLFKAQIRDAKSPLQVNPRVSLQLKLKQWLSVQG